MDKTLIGACGIYCRACDHYFANTKDGEHLLLDPKVNQRVSAHPCKGCKAEDETQICVYCVRCDVRLCSLDKGVQLCTACPQYPCGKLKRFETGLAHHREASAALAGHKELDAAQWERVAQLRWSCPSCGKKTSYYELTCPNCGQALAGMHPDLR